MARLPTPKKSKVAEHAGTDAARAEGIAAAPGAMPVTPSSGPAKAVASEIARAGSPAAAPTAGRFGSRSLPGVRERPTGLPCKGSPPGDLSRPVPLGTTSLRQIGSVAAVCRGGYRLAPELPVRRR